MTFKQSFSVSNFPNISFSIRRMIIIIIFPSEHATEIDVHELGTLECWISRLILDLFLNLKNNLILQKNQQHVYKLESPPVLVC